MGRFILQNANVNNKNMYLLLKTCEYEEYKLCGRHVNKIQLITVQKHQKKGDNRNVCFL